MPRFNTVGTALSNFAALRTRIPDPLFPRISYPTVEHYYQAQKFLDEALRLRIANASNTSPLPFRLPDGDTIDLKAGRAAKALSRIGTLRPDWESIKLPTMQEALRRKFEDPAFRQLLASTAPSEIAEINSWGDRFWGQDEFGYGLNHLGRLLTQLRDSIPPPITKASDTAPRIFVFGSNLAGIHGAGAAKHATTLGALPGRGVGHVGNTYAIPTKRTPSETLPLSEVAKHAKDFLDYARAHPDLSFDLTPVGMGLAGFKHFEIAPLFANLPPNVHRTASWSEHLPAPAAVDQGLQAFAHLRPTFQEVSNLLQRQASIPINISRKSRISHGDLEGVMGNHFSDFGRNSDPAHWDLPYREHLLKSVKENPAFAMLLRGLAGRPLNCQGCNTASCTERCHGSRLLNASMYLASPKGHLEFPIHKLARADNRNPSVLTTVGSRQTPPPILQAMERLGAQLSAKGYTLRSGHASGADQAWESGALRHSRTAPLEIYLPHPGFQGAPPNDPRYITQIHPNATNITNMRHPAPQALDDFAFKAMLRNAHQVLGPSLSDPSHAVLYWASTAPRTTGRRPDLSNNIKGGTTQAVRIAHAHGVPTIRIDENTSIDDLLAILSSL